MDSVTQLLLGAACVGALAPRDSVRRALIYGAALGTLPDLDALIPFKDPLDQLILHRSASHSLLVLPLVGWLIFQVASRFDRALSAQRWMWFTGFQLALLTHPLLDFFTDYGTQLFWPLSRYPFGTGSVFIIDPLVTIPLLIACVLAWIRQNRAGKSVHHPMLIALAISVSYLTIGLWTQSQTRAKVLADVPQNAILSVSAAPLTSLMHRVVVKTPGQYSEAYVSIFDGDEPVRWSTFESADGVFSTLESGPHFQRLNRFSKGLVKITHDNGRMLAHDLRMGSEPNYVFGFDFGTPTAPLQPVSQLPMQRPKLQALPWMAKRVITPAAEMPLPHEIAQ